LALNAGIKIEGLVEVQRALRKLEPELAKELKTELASVARDVAQDAQSRVPTDSGRARGSIRAGADVKGPYVAGGKQAVPYYAWLDFGSRRPKSGRPRSVGPWKGTGAGPEKGRFIYPAIDRNRDDVTARAVDAFENAKKQAGL
jgi:hypothetical protein